MTGACRNTQNPTRARRTRATRVYRSPQSSVYTTTVHISLPSVHSRPVSSTISSSLRVSCPRPYTRPLVRQTSLLRVTSSLCSCCSLSRFRRLPFHASPARPVVGKQSDTRDVTRSRVIVSRATVVQMSPN